MRSEPKTVAIAFDLNLRQAAEVFSGVSEYIRAHHLDWRLIPLQFGFEAQLMELADSQALAGAIGTFVSDSWVRALCQHGMQAVNLFQFSQIKHIPTVSIDNTALGRAAALHLKQQGARSYVFHGGDRAYFNQLRSDGFHEQLKGQLIIETHAASPITSEIELLMDLPKPVGVFCSSDRLARQFLLAAKSIGLRCPKDLLLVGVGAEPSESIFAGIELSSFKLPTATVGSTAAATLETLFNNEPAPGSTLIDQNELLTRESTLSSSKARDAQLTTNLIKKQLSNPELDVARIAGTMGLSRRSLELIFREYIGLSPYRYITQKRIELAKELLETTRYPVMEVGTRCGYPEPHHFSAWFKTQTGSAPRTYRENHASV